MSETLHGSDVAARIERFTVRPCGHDDDAGQPRAVVIVPPRGDLQLGFDLAKRLSRGRPVRLIGNGVTLPLNWPEWATGSTALYLTELGAYASGRRIDAAKSARRDLCEFLDATFGGVLDDEIRGSDLFYGSAGLRLFSQFFSDGQISIVENIARAHASEAIYGVGGDWPGYDYLETECHRKGGVLRRKRRRQPSWRVLFATAWLGGIGATVGRLLQSYIESRPSRERLTLLRRARDSTPTGPRIWYAVIPDWPRINQHVLDLLRDQQRFDENSGLLLYTSLASGARSESNLKVHTGTETWPALAEVMKSEISLTVDQAVGPESPLQLITLVRDFLRTSSRVAARILCQPSPLPRTSIRLDPAWLDLAKLATIDLARTMGAARALQVAYARQSFRGTTVIFSGSTDCAQAALHVLLRRRGATTVDFYHGWTIEPYPVSAETQSTIRCVWAASDVYSLPGQVCWVAGMPVRAERSDRPRQRLRRVLLMTNYLHRDDHVNGRFLRGPFLYEFLRIIPLLRNAYGAELDFRWRPHPADNLGATDAAHSTVRNVVLSRGTSLRDDLVWCDCAVTSFSTVLLEALFADVPVFAHVLPEFDGQPSSFLHRQRKFFRAHEILPLFAQCAAAVERGDPQLLAPEARARTHMFGADGRPKRFWEMLEQAHASGDGILNLT